MSADVTVAVLQALEGAGEPLRTAEVAKRAGFSGGHVRHALAILLDQGRVQRSKLRRGHVGEGSLGYRWRLTPGRKAEKAA